MRGNRSMLAALIFLAMLGLSCEEGGTGLDGIVDPTLDVTGQWEATWTTTTNACGATAATSPHSVKLTQTNNTIVWQDESLSCSAAANLTLSGNSATGQSNSQFTGTDGCTYQRNVSYSLTVSETSFSGTSVTTLTYVAGSNCTAILTSPCQVRENIAGTTCQNCYSGCTGGGGPN